MRKDGSEAATYHSSSTHGHGHETRAAASPAAGGMTEDYASANAGVAAAGFSNAVPSASEPVEAATAATAQPGMVEASAEARAAAICEASRLADDHEQTRAVIGGSSPCASPAPPLPPALTDSAVRRRTNRLVTLIKARSSSRDRPASPSPAPLAWTSEV